MSLLIFLLGPALAQECAPPPPALEDLNLIVSLIYSETGGAEDYCPDDLAAPLDLASADARAAQLSAQDRQDAAELLAEAVADVGLDHVQAVANTAALLDALLGAALASGEDPAAILDALLGLAAQLDDPLLRRQIALNLWRRGVEDDRVADLVAEFLPTEPDYDRLLPDGTTTVRATIRTGSDGFAHSDFQQVFERKGATVEVLTAGKHLRVTYPITPDDPTLPTLTWTLDIIDGGWGHQDAFAEMASADTSVTLFGDHSQLGTSLDRGLSNGPDAVDSTAFFWNAACKSKVFASRMSQQYPAGHFVFTKDSEYFRDMPVSFERGLVALSNRYDYDEMRRLVASGSAWQSTNYIFPDDPQKLVYQDQDGDGLADSEDRVYDVAMAVEAQGELATRAVHIANTYVGYSTAFGSGTRGAEDHYRPGGLFDGEPDGPATRIETRTDAFGEDKHFVAVNDSLLDLPQTQRTALITADVAAHWAEGLGWSETRTDAGALLAGAAVYDVWHGPGWSDYQDAVLPGAELSQSDATAYLDDHDFVTSKGVRELEEALAPVRED